MKLTVYLGFDSLATWLSLEGLRQLPPDCDLHFEPLLSSLGNVAGKPKQGDPLASYKAKRAKARRAFWKAEYHRICDRLGIIPEAGERQLAPLPPAVGLKWLTNQAEPASRILDYAEGVFTTHYRHSEDITTPEAVEQLLNKAGATTKGFNQAYDPLATELQTTKDDLLQSGILSSPAFAIEGEIFHGRQHFPLINWMLKGRKGPPPV